MRIYLNDNLALVHSALADYPDVQLIEPEGTFLLWLDFSALKVPSEHLHEFFRTRRAERSPEAFPGKDGQSATGLHFACPSAVLEASLAFLIGDLPDR